MTGPCPTLFAVGLDLGISSPTPVMPRLLERLGKLKGKSIDELRVRGAQAARARLELMGLSPDLREPSDHSFTRLFDCGDSACGRADGDAILHRFRQSDTPLQQHLPGLRDPSITARELQVRHPESAAATIAAAERIVDGTVDLGGRTMTIGRCPDWTFEPFCGRRAPAIHWSRIAFLDPEVAGDCKFTWELNRHQYLLTLARAYALTADDRYAARIVEHLSSWMDANPPKLGINWTSSLEVALRAISWIWAVHLVRSAPALEGRFFIRLLKQLYLHARHVEQYLSTYFSPNTHLTGEALGLLYIGAAFPELRRSTHWRALGLRILIEQLDRQLFADGVYFEQSTYYHRYTADFYVHALLLARPREQPLDEEIRAAVDGLLDHLVHVTRPDGTSPFIGDDDGGRLVALGERAANDFRDTLAVGAALLQRGDCAYVARGATEELIWLVGTDGIAAYDRVEARPPAVTSAAFPESGYYVMRDGWDDRADWTLLRCGPHASSAGAHAHADALSFELSVDGDPVLVDPGTYVYTASRAEREYFRGSAAHSTVTVDGRSSAEPAASPFKWRSVPRSRVRSWFVDDAIDFFEGEHDGYSRLDSAAVHTRAAFWLKDEYWVIRDRIRAEGTHHLASYLHWAPDVALRCDGEVVTACSAKDKAPRLAARLFARSGQLSHQDGWVSRSYGTRERAPISVLRLDSDGTEDIVMLLAKPRASVCLSDCAWRPAVARHSGILTIATASSVDTVLTGPADADRECGIVSDAAWTWVRRARSGELLAFAVIRGRQLVVDRCPRLEAETLLECAVGRHESGGWRVDVGGRSGELESGRSISERSDARCAAFVE